MILDKLVHHKISKVHVAEILHDIGSPNLLAFETPSGRLNQVNWTPTNVSMSSMLHA